MHGGRWLVIFYEKIARLMCFISVTMKTGSRQCKILLSRELILTIPDHFNSFVQAWSTILHEMAVSSTNHD